MEKVCHCKKIVRSVCYARIDRYRRLLNGTGVMDSSLERKTTLFLVRVWAEYLQRETSSLCGEIEHVQSKEKGYFHNIEELNHFLQNYSTKEKFPTQTDTTPSE